MNIAGHKVGLNYPPFIIAEMSGNHNQSLKRAIDIVREAAKSGVQAIKLQTYKPESITLNIQGGDFEIKDKKSLWYGKNLYDLYKVSLKFFLIHQISFYKEKVKNVKNK